MNNNINLYRKDLDNNSCNKDVNYSNNNQNQNKILLINNNNNSCNKVFNNIYIRRIIFNLLNKFNILYPVNVRFKSVKEFQQFKYKEYLNRVTLDFEDDQFELNQLPMNIKHITIRKTKKINDEHYEIIQIPDHIESVRYIGSAKGNYINSLSKQPHSSKIKNLDIYHHKEEEILPKQIPNSVTDLDIDTNILSNNILPSNLKKLSIRNLKSFEDNSLQIESLTHIRIEYSTPLILYQLSTPFFNNLVKLIFNNSRAEIDSNIQFPHNLKELIIVCKSFNYIVDKETNQLCQLQFPSSLEFLLIYLLYGNINVYFESLPPNLKSLKLPFSSIVDYKGQTILPNKLETWMIVDPFDQELKANQLPSTLTHLELSHLYNQVIDVNVLPANLNTLILGRKYSQIINPLAIPQQLKLLKIENRDYPHPINLISTHPNTVISCESLQVYYQAISSDYDQIRVLRLPGSFEPPLSILQLQNKSNLEYLHLGYNFKHPIELSDLPTQNNIKTLELGTSFCFKQTINLEYFQNLETLILGEDSNPTIITTTTTIIDDQQQQHLHYNNYKLKNIIASPKNVKFLTQLDINFYQFIKYNNK